jgi:hypothetical protein
MLATVLATVFASALLQAPPVLITEEQVPDAEKPAWAAGAVAKMKAGMKQLLTVLDEARGKKDVVRLNYVNVKLDQSKGLLRVGEQAEIQLGEALVRKDRDVVRHSFRKLALASERSAQIVRDAVASVGQSAVYSGATKVIVEGGTNVFDPTLLTLTDTMTATLLVRPFQVSPYE